jgi:GH3 auxin-responsive promoter
MNDFTLFLLKAYTNGFKSALIKRTRNVEQAQTEFLLKLLHDHQDTELGQKFGLATIKSIADFRRQVPIMPYEFYQPYVERIAAGEANVLNPEPVVYINLTSGSTGNKKQVPVTKQFQASLRRSNMAAIGFSLDALADRGAKFGKMLLTNSAILQGKTPAGIDYGPVSVGSLRQGRSLFERLFALPFETLTIADTVARHYVALLFALRDGELRGLTTNFPMLMLRTCGYLERYGPQLVTDLERGEINPDLPIDPSLRSTLAKRFKAAPDRAQFLRQVIAQHGYLTPILAWPKLSYICTARGGTSDFYLEQFPRYFGQTPISGGVFGTAEGTFGVYADVNVDGSILALESGFFEFVAEPDWDLEQPPTLLPTELTVGDRYRILVSSYSGFYRYDIGDVIEVVGFYHQAPLIVFRYRRGGLLSSTTEKTTEFHVTQVMQQLQQEFGVQFDDFCITLSMAENPARYVVNVELASGSSLANPIGFIGRFDELMGLYNDPYKTARHSDVPPPQLRILATGSFAQVRQQRVDRGMFDSQLKIPHISEDRRYLADLTVVESVIFGVNLGV